MLELKYDAMGNLEMPPVGDQSLDKETDRGLEAKFKAYFLKREHIVDIG